MCEKIFTSSACSKHGLGQFVEQTVRGPKRLHIAARTLADQFSVAVRPRPREQADWRDVERGSHLDDISTILVLELCDGVPKPAFLMVCEQISDKIQPRMTKPSPAATAVPTFGQSTSMWAISNLATTNVTATLSLGQADSA